MAAAVLPIVEASIQAAPVAIQLVTGIVHAIEGIFGHHPGTDKKAYAQAALEGALSLYQVGAAVSNKKQLSQDQMDTISRAIDAAVAMANAFGEFTHSTKL